MEKRDFNLDLTRVLAMLCVVANHAINSVYDITNYSYWINTNIFEKIFIILSYIFSRLGVPLFLMLTGILILKKNFENFQDILNFYKRKLFLLIITVCLWNIIYYFFILFYNNLEFNLKELILILLFCKDSPMLHMWYMPMIIGMYFFLPYVSLIVKKFSFREIIIPLLLSIISCIIIPSVHNFAIYNSIPALQIATILDVNWSGGVYGIYIIIGYYIWNKQIMEKYKLTTIIVLLIFSILISFIFQANGYLSKSNIVLYYDFIGLFIMSICILEIIRRMKKRNFLILKRLSIVSLGIFFVHRPILYILERYYILELQNWIIVIIYYFFTLCLSLCLIFLGSKIPIIKKYLLFIK